MIWLLIALQIADAVSTVIAINRGAFERNSVVAWIMQRVGVVPAIAAVKIPVCAFFIWVGQFPGADYGFAAASALYAWIVFNNVKVIRRLSK